MIRSLTAASAFIFLLTSLANAQTQVTYVEADSTGVAGTVSGNTVLNTVTAEDPNLINPWQVRDFGVQGTVYQASNNAFGELQTTISGLTAGTEYNVYAFFWNAGSAGWFVDASLNGGSAVPNSEFTNYVANDANNVNGPIFEAAALDISNLGDINGTNPLSETSPGATNTINITLDGGDNQRSDQTGPGNQNLYAVNLGSIQASGLGEIDAFIRNVAQSDRVWYDGLGYQIFNNLTLTVELGSGEAVLNSRSSQAIEIGAYEITSAAGSLDTGWNGIRDDVTGWDDNTGTTGSLAEASDFSDPGGQTNELTINLGDSYDLGNIYTPGADADLQFTYFRSSDSTLQAGEIRYVLGGDFNEDGTVDAADYTVWRDNLGAAEGTLPNDFDGGVIGAAQYARWAANFGSSLPSASAATASAVPEPSTAILALVSCLGIYTARKTR